MCKPTIHKAGSECETWNGESWSDGTTTSSCPYARTRMRERDKGFNPKRVYEGSVYIPTTDPRHYLNGGPLLPRLPLTPKPPITIPVLGTTFTPSWEGLASWTRGQKRPGPRYERVMVTNPAERCSERQIKVRGIIECNWPSDQFAIQDVTVGVQKGCDFCVYSKTGNLIAKIDAKSSNTMSAAQVRTALECEQAGIEYWIVSETRRMLITSQCQFEPTQYRVHEGENNGSTKD